MVMSALTSALSGLALRQRVTAANVANIQTPGYTAGRVDFESSLRDAISNGGPVQAPTVARSLEPTREDGNNVNLDEESLSMVDTNLRYQLLTQAVSGRFATMRTALRTQ